MVKKIASEADDNASSAPIRAHILIFEGRFYTGVADMLAEGAVAELEARGATFERIEVPGALELPQAFAAAAAAKKAGRVNFDGAVALGCVIRGETAHYDIVCENANHWLMRVAVDATLPVGNGILTVENEAQAIARAEGGRAGKGGDAARACLRLIELNRKFWESRA